MTMNEKSETWTSGGIQRTYTRVRGVDETEQEHCDAFDEELAQIQAVFPPD